MERTITLSDADNRLTMFGSADRHLKLIRDAFGVRVFARGATIKLDGESAAVDRAAAVIDRLRALARERAHIRERDVSDVIAEQAAPRRDGEPRMDMFVRGTVIQPKTDGQRHYIHAMLN
ncbi:MAG: hypothetical protein V3T70_00855, partial [Phycisphaerae bacterium]